MRTSSIKSGVFALTLVALLTAAPTYAATRQDRDGGRVSRLVEKVLRFIGGAYDLINVPKP
jgi:hypothetical protein